VAHRVFILTAQWPGRVASLVDDSVKLTRVTLHEFLTGQGTLLARVGELPRMIFDSLRQMADANANQSFRGIMHTLLKIRVERDRHGLAGGGSTLAEPASVLTLPEVERIRFEKNFIKTAVCELRFPALLEFETKPPVQLQRELREDFPNYQRQLVPIPNTQESETRHILRSKKGDWLVSFKSASIALETTKYTHFEDFFEQLAMVVKKSTPLLDTDFFTRVGLRYINEIRIEDGTPEGWIRDELISATKNVYGPLDRFVQEVRGLTPFGKYTFRHGIAGPEEDKRNLYTIDFDFYEENVELDRVMSLVSEFNHQSLKFFLWVIGPKVKERLGRTIPHRERK
jgi:uncharacterized protein (TIGR04255 family)